EKVWRAEIDRLRKKYSLAGYATGSLPERSWTRYDRIRNGTDLVPDLNKAVTGHVVDEESNPVPGAEVVLVEPVDESVSNKRIIIYLNNGKLRSHLEEVVV